jgi:hypothetical protein
MFKMKYDTNIIDQSDFLHFVINRKPNQNTLSTNRASTTNMDRSLYSNIMYRKKHQNEFSYSMSNNTQDQSVVMDQRINIEKEHIITMNKHFAQML